MFFEDDEGLDPDVNNLDAVLVNGFDVRKAVFVIPLGAPLPTEVNDKMVPVGSLYKRLFALDQKEWALDEDFAFVPLSGAELLALERVWHVLSETQKVVLLTDIPAARYDVLFTQAARQIGLPSVDWPSISEALSERALTRQRTKDAQPWTQEVGPDDDEVPEPGARPRSKLPRVSKTEVDLDSLPGEDD